MTDEAFEPFRLGRRARVKDESINPYLPMDPKHKEWRNGWIDMDRHLTERDEALRSIGWIR